jgi:D-arabinose 1-dehydrogenase-like Zn-dependent alcohol dehydrogenase
VKPYIEKQPLARITEVFDEVRQGRFLKRVVLVP